MDNNMPLNRIEDKVDKLQEDISEIKVTMAVNTESLKEHMSRTMANEEALEVLKKELTPVHNHVLKMQFLINICGVIFACLAAGAALIEIVKFLTQ